MLEILTLFTFSIELILSMHALDLRPGLFFYIILRDYGTYTVAC